MANVELVDELQERVARYVDERLSPILRKVNQLDDLLSTETTELTSLGKQLLALRTQGGNAQGTSTQRIKLMTSGLHVGEDEHCLISLIEAKIEPPPTPFVSNPTT